MRNKYGARKVFYGDHWFDSQVEARRYQELVLLEYAGEISQLQAHPTYILIPAFTDQWGNHERAITYKPDFSYLENGHRVCEDIKSKATKTDSYSLRRRLFRKTFPHIEFREVIT